MTMRYTQEFREEAARHALESDQTRIEIARNFGVSVWTLREWIKRYQEKSGVSTGTPKVETLEEENRRLRRDVERLKMERDILKKAAAYFAKEQF